MRPEKLSQSELDSIARLNSNVVNELAFWANKNLTCVHCKKCTLRCEVLKEPSLDIGLVEESYQKIASLSPSDQPDAVIKLVQEHPTMYHALRRCCFCGFCTSPCQTHMLAPERMREWRELFMRSGLMPPEESKLVMVDNEWHIFSAYRAIHGISYPEFTMLQDAAEGEGADTLFFPGCSLVSYMPELTRKVGQWLNSQGVNWVLSDDCCGSPLMSAGLFDRGEALRQRIFDQIKAAGIKRILTVCPGCGEEFAELMGPDIDIVPLPEFLLKEFDSIGKIGEVSELWASTENPSFTFFDSCHDRHDNRHAIAIRKLLKFHFPQSQQIEMNHRRKGTLCCGAGGAVASYDSDITERRTWRVIEEAHSTKADVLVTMCPTCTYTISQACLGANAKCNIINRHYLELVFDESIDWAVIFDQLGSMWTGEYGPWLNETFFG